MRAVHIGTFDAEKFWRPEDHAVLPKLINNCRFNPVIYMDELLFAFTEKNDLLFTNKPFDSDLYEYLSDLEYEFSNIPLSGDENADVQEKLLQSLELSLLGEERGDYQPYAITHYTDKVIKQYNFINDLPTMDSAIEVNSKLYSSLLANKINCNPYESITIHNIKDLNDWGMRSLEEYHKIVIKTPYGVSGNGNILIDDITMLDRMIRHFVKEVSKGKQIQIIIEPYVNKSRDFSAHYYINEAGAFEFRSIQFMNNKGFNYSGSYQSSDNDIKLLHEKNYFEYCEKIMNSIYAKGYWGPVCIDSMELDNGVLVPLVEINARKSMGLLNVHLQNRIKRLGSNLKSHFMFFNVGAYGCLNFKRVYQLLKKEKLLVTKDTIREDGVWIISAICYHIFQDETERQCKQGRIYFSILAQEEGNCTRLRNRFSELLKENGILVY